MNQNTKNSPCKTLTPFETKEKGFENLPRRQRRTIVTLFIARKTSKPYTIPDE